MTKLYELILVIWCWRCAVILPGNNFKLWLGRALKRVRVKMRVWAWICWRKRSWLRRSPRISRHSRSGVQGAKDPRPLLRGTQRCYPTGLVSLRPTLPTCSGQVRIPLLSLHRRWQRRGVVARRERTKRRTPRRAPGFAAPEWGCPLFAVAAVSVAQELN